MAAVCLCLKSCHIFVVNIMEVISLVILFSQTPIYVAINVENSAHAGKEEGDFGQAMHTCLCGGSQEQL